MLGTSQGINREFSAIFKLLMLFRKAGVSLINEGWRLDFSCRNWYIDSAILFQFHSYILTQGAGFWYFIRDGPAVSWFMN